jgi:hypothetical protein
VKFNKKQKDMGFKSSFLSNDNGLRGWPILGMDVITVEELSREGVVDDDNTGSRMVGPFDKDELFCTTGAIQATQ